MRSPRPTTPAINIIVVTMLTSSASMGCASCRRRRLAAYRLAIELPYPIMRFGPSGTVTVFTAAERFALSPGGPNQSAQGPLTVGHAPGKDAAMRCSLEMQIVPPPAPPGQPPEPPPDPDAPIPVEEPPAPMPVPPDPPPEPIVART